MSVKRRVLRKLNRKINKYLDVNYDKDLSKDTYYLNLLDKRHEYRLKLNIKVPNYIIVNVDMFEEESDNNDGVEWSRCLVSKC